MGRCIMVFGTPRSGTSCVAGLLWRLGINMGEGWFQAGDKNNQRGYWEDNRWQKINKDLSGRYSEGLYYDVVQPKTIGPKQHARYRELIAECDQQTIWGFKNVRSVFLARFIVPYLDDVRFVITERDIEHSARSIKEHSRVSHGGQLYMTIKQARALINIYLVALKQRMKMDVPIHVVNYRRLIATNKIAEVAALADFCFDGLDIRPTPDEFKEARGSLYKRMDHYYV